MLVLDHCLHVFFGVAPVSKEPSFQNEVIFVTLALDAAFRVQSFLVFHNYVKFIFSDHPFWGPSVCCTHERT